METRVRVLTFNVRGCQHKDGNNEWPRRTALNVATIKRAAPDIIGFQEIEQGNLDVYETELPDYQHVLSPPQEMDPPSGFSAIFWRKDRFELLDSDGFWLSRTPDRHGVDWGAQCVRAAVWVKLRCRESGVCFLLLNTHLDHISELARVEGARTILRRLTELQAEGLPVIVTGDFNCSPWAPAHDAAHQLGSTNESYRLFVAEGFEDAYLKAGGVDGDDSHTFHAFAGPDYATWPAPLGWRLDWILTRDGRQRVEVESCAIIRDAEPPLFPSDHYPVLAELRLVGDTAEAEGEQGS